MAARRRDKHQRNTGDSRTAAPRSSLNDFVEDPETGEMAEFRRLQHYQATKTYVCPGCNQEIRPGTGHVVIVPLRRSDDRRHWHTPCWEHRGRRRPTGR
jgi:hypothetical protein